MDFIKDSLTTMEMLAKSKGLPMSKACELANIHPSTPSRWRNGRTSPRMQEFAKLYEAIVAYSAPRKGKPK